jgi:signal transduction histidine kinase
MKAPLPKNELQRLDVLRQYDILDTQAESAYDDIVQLAAHICGTPISLISLLDADRQWFKSRTGLSPQETHRDLAFCGHTILEPGMMVVPDTTQDARFSDNPLVTSDPKIRFYAGAPLTTPDGYKLGTLCVIDRVPRNLTDDQRNALRTLARQVMTQMELGQRDRQKSEFVSMVSHELRTPLTSIRGALGLLNSGAAGILPDRAKTMADVALRNTEHVIRMINQLLDLGKIESGMMELCHKKMDVNSLVRDAIEMSRPFAEKHGVTVFAKLPTATIVIESDHDRVVQVLTNLISNATKASPYGETVDVAIHMHDGVAHVTVTDHGSGIPASFQPRIFQKFSRAELSTSRSEGTGLGLNISKAIIEKMGGKIGFTSGKRGTEFFFDLPIAWAEGK